MSIQKRSKETGKSNTVRKINTFKISTEWFFSKPKNQRECWCQPLIIQKSNKVSKEKMFPRKVFIKLWSNFLHGKFYGFILENFPNKSENSITITGMERLKVEVGPEL